MGTPIIETPEPAKAGLTQRVFIRFLTWIGEEIRLAQHARIRAKAENGEAKAQYALGTMYEMGEVVPHCAAEALKWYQKAAFQGIAEAQLTLGLKYLSGEGVMQNDSEALLWFRKAAEQGHPEAQHHLGNLYRDGRGTTRDLLQACKWYRKAAERGHSGAMKNLRESIPRETELQAEVPGQEPRLAVFSETAG